MAELEQFVGGTARDKANAVVNAVNNLTVRQVRAGAFLTGSTEGGDTVISLSLNDLLPHIPKLLDIWIGKLDAEGQTPYDDERYWVVKQQVANDSTDSAEAVTFENEDPLFQVTATNFAEVLENVPGGQDVHLMPGTNVFVFATEDKGGTGTPRYAFYAGHQVNIANSPGVVALDFIQGTRDTDSWTWPDDDSKGVQFNVITDIMVTEDKTNTTSSLTFSYRDRSVTYDPSGHLISVTDENSEPHVFFVGEFFVPA